MNKPAILPSSVRPVGDILKASMVSAPAVASARRALSPPPRPVDPLPEGELAWSVVYRQVLAQLAALVGRVEALEELAFTLADLETRVEALKVDVGALLARTAAVEYFAFPPGIVLGAETGTSSRSSAPGSSADSHVGGWEPGEWSPSPFA